MSTPVPVSCLCSLNTSCSSGGAYWSQLILIQLMNSLQHKKQSGQNSRLDHWQSQPVAPEYSPCLLIITFVIFLLVISSRNSVLLTSSSCLSSSLYSVWMSHPLCSSSWSHHLLSWNRQDSNIIDSTLQPLVQPDPLWCTHLTPGNLCPVSGPFCSVKPERWSKKY